jgi:hypothetical protein
MIVVLESLRVNVWQEGFVVVVLELQHKPWIDGYPVPLGIIRDLTASPGHSRAFDSLA